VLQLPEILRGIQVLAHLKPGSAAFPLGGWLVMLARNDPRIRHLVGAGYDVSFPDPTTNQAIVEPINCSSAVDQ
jgi:hypothetical protein